MWKSKSVNYRSFRSAVEVWHLHHGTCVLVPFDQGVACGAGNGGILFDCSNIFGHGIQAFIHLIQMGMNRCQRTGHQFRKLLQILFRHGRLFPLLSGGHSLCGYCPLFLYAMQCRNIPKLRGRFFQNSACIVWLPVPRSCIIFPMGCG